MPKDTDTHDTNIDKGIPVPQGRGRKKDPESVSGRLRTLASAEVGDSMRFTLEETSVRKAAMIAIAVAGKGWYAARTVSEDGNAYIRVWKMSEPKVETSNAQS